MCDTLEAVLCDCDVAYTHREFEVLMRAFVPTFCPKTLMSLQFNTLLATVQSSALAQVDRPDLQLLVEHLFILAYLHLSDDYQVYWLTKKPTRPARLAELIRATGVALEAMLTRNSLLDDSGGKNGLTVAVYTGGIQEFVQSMREVYAMGMCRVGKTLLRFEDAILRDEADKTKLYELEQPFRAHFAAKVGVRTEEFRFPWEKQVCLDNVDKRALLRALWHTHAAASGEASPPLEEAALDQAMQAQSLGPRTKSGVFCFAGRPIYVDIFAGGAVDPRPHDKVYGRGRFLLLLKRVALSAMTRAQRS